MMKILFYSARQHAFSEEIAHYFSRAFLQYIKFKVTHEIIKLRFAFGQQNKHWDMAILFASSGAELDELLTIKHEFFAVPIILILPDESVDTMQKGMLLKPLCFMTQHDSFSYLASIVMSVSEMIMADSHILSATRLLSSTNTVRIVGAGKVKESVGRMQREGELGN